MDIRLLTTPAELEAYDAWVLSHPQGTLWQSRTWKRFQKSIGRKVRIYAAIEEDQIVASALVVIDETAFGLSTWDIPRGPLRAGSDQPSLLREELRPKSERVASSLLDYIVQDARKEKCMALYLSPLSLLPATRYALRASSRHEQPEATRIVDLTLSEEEILKQMHQKGRYNIKVAEKNGVHVERSTDGAAFGELLHKTAARDGFAAASVSHYEAFLKNVEGSFLLLAFAEGNTPIAGLMGVIQGKTAIYYYGASDYEHRALMAPYSLQWEAMLYGKHSGCTQYDLLGVAPPAADEGHAWQGISRFKEKFGGAVISYPPEQCIILKPTAFRALELKRRLLG